MSRHFYSCNIINEVKPELYTSTKSKYAYKNINTQKIFEIDNIVNEYMDVNGITNYKFKMIQQCLHKVNKLDKVINNICNTLFISVVDNLDNSIDNSGNNNIINYHMTFTTDESELNSVNIPVSIPELTISITVHDNNGIYNMIKMYKQANDVKTTE
jgi:hypothetical protein